MMWMILQTEVAEDWVIATGKTTTVRDFVKMSFAHAGVELTFKVEGKDEKGVVASCTNPKYQVEVGKEVVAVDPTCFRPTEVDLLIGDPTKANSQLGWKHKISLKKGVEKMYAWYLSE